MAGASNREARGGGESGALAPSAALDEWILVGRTEEIPPGEDLIVTVHGTEIGIYNLDGEFYGVRNYCPHRGAPVCRGVRTGTMIPSDEEGRFVWGLEGRVIRCPWHRWEFDIVTGRTLFDIDKRRLIQYRVSVEDGHVYLHLRPEEIRRLRAGEDRLDDKARAAGAVTE